MKLIFLTLMLLASLLLTSCEKNNKENLDNNSNVSINNQETPNTLTKKNTERLSYKDYVEKYDDNSVLEEPKEIITNNDVDETPIEEIKPMNEIPANQLATYSTPLLSSSKNRVNNIKIVCERLNNFILKPNETFSYNNVAGPYGPSDGFKEATILLSDGSKSKGYGGGVCQLSSTLYNVVKNLKNVEITERHHHSAPVAYVPKGEDATISLQSGLDFKFVNNNSYSIRFEAKCENGKVIVSAFKES